MTDRPIDHSSTRSWWLALAALAVCAPWSGWMPGIVVRVVLLALLALLALLGRPRGRDGWFWLGVVIALAGAIAPVGPEPTAAALSGQLDGHCRRTLATATRVVDDERLTRIFSATGEALDPTRPFAILDDVARETPGRTLYLSDDRGRILAWGGVERSYPIDLRPLGPRAWSLEWSAVRGVLSLREPIMIEGRIVGSLTVADRAELATREAWGMRSGAGRELVLGRSAPGAVVVASDAARGVAVPVGSTIVPSTGRRTMFGLGWLVLAVSGLIVVPRLAWSVVAVAVAVAIQPSVAPSSVERVMLTVAAGAAVGRLCRQLSPTLARVVVVGALAGAVALRLTGASGDPGAWLPDHLLRPGWGGVWMVALAWIAVSWPSFHRTTWPLERRMLAAAALGLLALLVEAAWYPVRILDLVSQPESRVVLPRAGTEVGDALPTATDSCRLDDLASVLARRWGLDDWSTPSRLAVVRPDGSEWSSWGDLSPAGDRRRRVQGWDLAGGNGARVELEVATEPWSWLHDWSSGDPLEDAWRRPVWFAVLTRSGSVAATLHPEVGDLDPTTAGDAYHSGGIWTRMPIGGGWSPARVVRRGEWLLAVVAHPPAPPVWVIRAALAVLWALLGMVVAKPPRIRREQLATFGGRLRLLVSGGVVVPLVILTLFLQLRLGREDARIGNVFGLSALGAASYTVEHLGGGIEVDDGLASWLARGWGGEVVFFDETVPVAVSRPDLMFVGRLPQLPAVEAYAAYLLGRPDPVVFQRDEKLTAAAAVDVDGRWLLLHLIRTDPLRTAEAPDAVDWLLTGALLAALIAVIVTSRIEDRLSTSLRDLVGLAGRLVRGETVGSVRRPRETDLAEVLDAVRSMNEEVRRRELSLRHQEELLRITLANLQPAVLVLEPGGGVRFANPSAERLLDEHGDRVRELIDAHIDAPGGVAETAATVQPVPGRDLTWRVGVAGVPLPDGSRGLVAVIDDVTEIVRLDRLRQLNQLARIVAHEVKNPLTPIRLWVQELTEARARRAPDLDEMLADACSEIAHQVERLHQTANSFSNLVALESWQPEAVDLAEVVTGAAAGLGVLRRRGIALDLKLPPPGEVRVTADRQWLMRAVGNLVQNSIDAVADQPGEIRVTVVGDAGRALVEVEDTGGGVAAEQLPDLFSPHFSTTASGSGLGLALVHHVVTRCQGRLEAANGPRGLVVRIDLPRL